VTPIGRATVYRFDFPYLTQQDILACLAYAADREQTTGN
jgi:uncharacterized protein (DUF433 family)